MASKKEVETSFWKESFKELGGELISTLKTTLIIVGVIILVLGVIYYVPVLFGKVL